MWLLSCLLLLCARTVSVASVPLEGFNAIEGVHLYNAIDALGEHPVSLKVNTTTVSGRGKWIEVTWSGVRHPQFDDWVGVFAPAYASVRSSTPVKYKLATASSTHFEEGRGSVTFLLENHRESMRIGFFFNGFDNPHLVAQSPTITCEDVNMPLHGRVTLTGDNTEAVVQWTTHDSAGGQVQLGTKPRRYTEIFDASDMRYDRTDMCGGAAEHEGWLDPGIFHFAVLKGLIPGKRYYYRFGSQGTGFSKEFSFLAAPPVGPETHVKIIALADMGQSEPDGANEQSEMVPSGNTSRLMLAEVAKGGYSLVGHYGDISYARGHVSQWDRFHVQMEPLIANVPYMIGIGNHERDWPDSGAKLSGDDSGGECGVAHERRFLMPTTKQDQPWFSFEHGPITFVHISTEHYFHKGSAQHHAVKRMLAAVDRRRTPWLVVTGHRPFYIDSIDDSEPSGDLYVAHQLREAYEELYMKYGVDLTLHGHHHSYQRTCPVYKGECVGYDDDGMAKGPVHLVIGNAGAGLSYKVQDHKPKVFEKVHLWWGFTRIHASGTKLKVDAISDADGKVFDTLKLRKTKHWGKHWHNKHGKPHSHKARPQFWWEQDEIETPPQVLMYRQAQLDKRGRRSN